MKRSGFTMIELIFVIVILGILAAVAIPKLAATRDDAEISKAKQNIATLVSDIGNYYTAQGSIASIADMTNVEVNDSNDTNGSKASIQIGSDAGCITVRVDNNGTLSLFGGSGSSVACTKIKSDITSGKIQNSYNFGGSRIN